MFVAWICLELVSQYYISSMPGMDFFWLDVSGVGLLALSAIWFLRFLIRAVLIWNAKDPTLRIWRQGWRWLVPVAVLGTSIALNHSGLPRYVRFAASRLAMERLVQEVMTTPGPYATRRVGLYYACDIERTEFGVRFIVQGEESAARRGHRSELAGFAYSVEPLPAHTRGDLWTYRPLHGPWYVASGLRVTNLEWLKNLPRSRPAGP